jgi:ABC-type Mn2+/Zn2+ transport system permease subunit
MVSLAARRRATEMTAGERLFSTRYLLYSVLDMAIRIAILLTVVGVLLVVAFLIARYLRSASHVEVWTLSFSTLVVASIIVARLNRQLGVRGRSLWPTLKAIWRRAADK